MRCETIGARLKEERERLGLSQTAFAEGCGLKKLAQINYEKGERMPDAEYLLRASQLGADVLYILTGRRERPASELTDRARLQAAIEVIEEVLGERRLPPDKKAEAILLAYDLLAEPATTSAKVVELLRKVA
ncbi:helix-turn-helix transcriptional regulator [Pelomicrobium methylotrophicum]|uniref:Helix-turn-helix transcriptional regulator n=1 Tax=Pelomicrobium methylotrophicum TaxID=2602750 RepID=A0A5C7EIM2_9PROT|nr:helix-turn-helix transcriptional regulator [Pelomicrobium methylotrophicum]